MDDLISREQTVEEIKSVFDWHDVVTVDRLVEHIKALQSQQKTGKWIESEQRDRTICSVCGHWQDLKAKFLFSFCPNCGSLMRGGYTNENISDS